MSLRIHNSPTTLYLKLFGTELYSLATYYGKRQPGPATDTDESLTEKV